MLQEHPDKQRGEKWTQRCPLQSITLHFESILMCYWQSWRLHFFLSHSLAPLFPFLAVILCDIIFSAIFFWGWSMKMIDWVHGCISELGGKKKPWQHMKLSNRTAHTLWNVRGWHNNCDTVECVKELLLYSHCVEDVEILSLNLLHAVLNPLVKKIPLQADWILICS